MYIGKWWFRIRIHSLTPRAAIENKGRRLRTCILRELNLLSNGR